MNTFLDIIIPEYDCKLEYMVRLLDSINKQKNINFKELGIIIVNDKSKNKYKKSWFKQRYPKLNIEYLVKEINEGQGLTRQYGLDRSNAKYVTFIDQDDLLYDNLSLYNVINYLKNNEVEKLHTSFIEENRDGSYIRYGKHDLECLHALFLKRDFLLKYNVRFSDKFRYHEDVYYLSLVNALVNEDLSVYYDIVTYVWKCNLNSQVRSNRDFYFHFDDFVKAQLYSLKYLDSINKNNKLTILANIFSLYVPLASNIFDDTNNELKIYGEKELYNYIKNINILNELTDDEIKEYTNIVYKGNLRTHSDMIIKESFKDFINRLEKTYGDYQRE